ncbi:hypothetical protein EV385_6005 [Krasilnikovia cinnamomea]|uniref:Uncharacterized protein n=1 Tax=Krasilnikovia cinnamomea TaxID=349313 RepID=A0A4Q7ZSB2_9ACTN|nr:hypothetical protein [Krasilnikovia cinnamomea]RZU54068.1 hypothetical protein EV385_6005 [Krasilnikovia cinnamomea]
MSRVLRIELRRSVAFGAVLTLLLGGAVLLYAAPQRWSAGWMALAMTQRQYLVLLWPSALAAGAWQARREHRANVAELFASTARPPALRALPVLGALAIAAAGGYLAAAAVAVPWIIDTASYLPAASFAVAAVGVVSLVAAAWLGLALGRLLPSPFTAPAAAVAGMGLLLTIPALFRDREWLTMLFSPMYGMGQYTDYQTVDGRVSAAQAIWLAALAVAGGLLVAAGNRRARLVALLPLALGAGLGLLVIPRGADFPRNPVDPAAQELVCRPGTPRVCVSRVHEALLPEVVPLAQRALTTLAKLPDAPTSAQEDLTTYFGDPPPPPGPDIVPIPVHFGSDGHLAAGDDVLRRILNGFVGLNYSCPGGHDTPVIRAAVSWLTGREPVAEPEEPAEYHPRAVTLWQGLRRLPEAEAAARVAAVRKAAMTCADTDGLLNGGSR